MVSEKLNQKTIHSLTHHIQRTVRARTQHIDARVGLMVLFLHNSNASLSNGTTVAGYCNCSSFFISECHCLWEDNLSCRIATLANEDILTHHNG